MCVNAETEINYSQIQLKLDFVYLIRYNIAALLGIGYGFRVDRSDPRSTTDRGCELCSERSPGTETELTFSSRKRCVVSLAISDRLSAKVSAPLVVSTQVFSSPPSDATAAVAVTVASSWVSCGSSRNPSGRGANLRKLLRKLYS